MEEEEKQTKTEDLEAPKGPEDPKDSNDLKDASDTEAAEESPAEEQPVEEQPAESPPPEPDWKDRYARTMADFDNFRKRTARDREDLVKFAASDVLKDILRRWREARIRRADQGTCRPWCDTAGFGGRAV